MAGNGNNGGGGARRKPTVLALLQNRPASKMPKVEEVFPEGELFAAPRDLNAIAREQWDYHVQHAPVGLLRLLDAGVMRTYIEAYARYLKATQHIEAEGEVLIIPGGKRKTTQANGVINEWTFPEQRIENPWIKVMRDSRDAAMRLVRELGFSPTSRTRISVPLSANSKAENRFARHAAATRRT